MSAYVIGLTGGIACGKSNLSSALRAAGAQVIDADALSRATTAPGGPALPAIRSAFGDAVFDGNVLNRRALGQLVFADASARAALNGIIHPLVLAQMRREIDSREGIVFLDVPLLYECGIDRWCNEVWCAYVPQREQLRRLRARDGLTGKEALSRVRAQMPPREKARRADQIIRTDGSRESSAQIVLSLWQDRLAKFSQAKGETP